jgi:uncharacterized membrane protein
VSDTQPSADSERENNARILAIVVYALYLLALANGLTAIAGVVVAYIKRGDAKGTPYYGHFSAAITTFWVVLIAGALLVALTLQLVFGTLLFYQHPVADLAWHPSVMAALPLIWLGFVVLLIFYLYRTIKGLVRAVEGRPY